MNFGSKATKSEMILRAEHPINPGSAKMPMNNTLGYSSGDTWYCHYHNTEILAVYANGGFKITTGGWNTLTTKVRLNEFLPAPWRIGSSKGIMELWNYTTNKSYQFEQTIAVGPRGGITSDFKPSKVEKRRKMVEGYVTLYKREGLPTAEDSGGDPWVVGAIGSYVMMDWIKSGYRHRRLYTLALDHAGIRDVGISIYLSMCDHDGGKLDNMAIRRIRKYINDCLKR